MLLLVLTSSVLITEAQEKFTISGYIEDAETKEKLIGANIYIPSLEVGTSTNTYGFYSLTVPAQKELYLSISYIGYSTKNYKIDLTKNVSLNFQLIEGEELETLEIVANEANKIEDEVQMSQVTIPIQQIKNLPAFMGEVDVLKVLQLMPGVQSGGEGTSGLYVRGGSPDQNLMLLDGVPLYNVSHLFGFFSVFNADAIKNVTLTKGGFPARYGGRLSSVLDINMKEGNMREFHGEGSVSNIASKFTFEGPIVKDKASFMVSARRTYIDIFMKPIIAIANAQEEEYDVWPRYYFYDINAKLNYKINEKDRLYFSVYNGKDDFGVTIKEESDNYSSEGGLGLDWGNTIAALRWNHVWNGKLFSNTSVTYSKYNFNTGVYTSEIDQGETESIAGIYTSGIEDWAGKIDFDYIVNPQNYIRFGTSITRHTFSPGATNLESTSNTISIDTTIGSDNIGANEFIAYVEDEIRLGAFKANIGLHLSVFDVNGNTYSALQPRIGLNYKLSNGLAIKASFAQMQQYINLLTNEGIGLPTDLWVPSTENIKPQKSWQTGIGLAQTFGAFEVSLEGYYKEMDNLLSYKEGASFLFSTETDWESKVTQGTGDAYGVELFVQKKKGKTTGWIGYTLAWSNRQFDEINGGKPYPFTYDRRHDISIVLAHEFNEKWSASAAWIYGTGRAVTLPLYKYYGGLAFNTNFSPIIERAESKNSFRMSAYQRLDLSVKYYKKKKYYDSWWSFSVYNAYNHLNPFFMTSASDEDGNNLAYREFGLFPLIPAVAYLIKF